MIKIIRNYNLDDIVDGMRYLLEKASHSMEVRALAIEKSQDCQDKISAIYDFMKYETSYVPDPIGIHGDIELFISPVRMVEDYNKGIRPAGDCVTGDTPIWIKRGGLPELVEIRELLPTGRYAQFLGVDILTSKGFNPLVSIRKKETKKPVIRLLGTSDIGLTIDHKLLYNPNFHDNGRYIEAGDVKGNSQLIKIYPEVDEIYGGDYELGWAYGLLFADGGCAYYHPDKYGGESWGISNTNTDYLERAKAAFEKEFPQILFTIRIWPSDRLPTNYGPRNKPLATLCAKLRENHNDGTWGRFVHKQADMFYNSLRIKKVPTFILHGNADLIRGFWDGEMAGDGCKCDLTITSATKLATMGLSVIARRLGKNVMVRAEGGTGTFKGNYIAARNPNKYNSIHPLNKYDLVEKRSTDDSTVYDISTVTGDFVAGDVLAKNCDDQALLATALYRSIGIPSHVILVDSGGNGLDHAYCEVYSSKLNEFIPVDPSSDYPLGWKIQYKEKIVVE